MLGRVANNLVDHLLDVYVFQYDLPAKVGLPMILVRGHIVLLMRRLWDLCKFVGTLPATRNLPVWFGHAPYCYDILIIAHVFTVGHNTRKAYPVMFKRIKCRDWSMTVV